MTIRAKGQIGSERIELRYGSTVLAGYTLTTEFADYTTEVGPGLVDGLTVNFVNNALVNGQDRNVFVDYLEIDGQRVQAEDPAIPSQGHYANGSCGYGLKQTEKLHCNGYFDFSGRFGATTPPPVDPPPVDPPPTTGDDTVTVYAAGLVGGEIINLVIDGQVVTTRTLAAAPNFYGSSVAYEELTHTHSTSLANADIRVQFTNNAIVGGQDRNVRVDAIAIDGTRYESEDPTVIGTGVWRNGGNCQPGTWSSEYLHCNGYFQYAVD